MEGTSETTPVVFASPARFSVFKLLEQALTPFLSSHHLMLCASELPDTTVQSLASGSESALSSNTCSECGQWPGDEFYCSLTRTAQEWLRLHSCSRSCHVLEPALTPVSLKPKIQEK